ncbi:acid trehalase-like protein 1 [Cavenderia fasciculata]|uniref:Acid trehalase-like protein 1 n=1 Tax=Cavenderia fasciculata TaxID=261658 RepID=F4QB32_CACFS|nr:acid trehalase-like protein 1 [Cavenderia fasciculata]EGG14804.1 acid trehalase-like protein 1 [Cavenderia fasciculata]|eukprot:XP_004351320.1 acid trehalase-like protein 1 [Cavenderia fasciculata]
MKKSITFIMIMIMCMVVNIVKGQPDWWNDRVNQGQILSTTVEPESSLMATVGNGYASYVVGGDFIYIGGIFNGPELSIKNVSHRAAFPNYQNIVVENSDVKLEYAGLDIENATYTRVFSFASSPSVTVEQVFYASQTDRNTLIQEITIDNTNGDGSFVLQLNNPTDLEVSDDLEIEVVYSDDTATQYLACIKQPEVNFTTCAAVTTATLNGTVEVSAGQKYTVYYVTAFYSNLEDSTGNNDLISVCAGIFKQIYSEIDQMLQIHKDAWAHLWQSDSSSTPPAICSGSKNYAFQSIVGMAEFWASRVLFDTDTQQYVINGVIPPDEYAIGVNNSVYTNVVASIALEWAIEAAQLIGKTESIPAGLWQTIADNIKIPFDSVNQRHPEYDGYKGQTIKQADVILLGFPLMYNMTPEVRQNDLAYYETVTNSQGPAMTHSMYTIGWLELGNTTKASESWPLSYANAQQPFKIWTETPTGGCVNFITGAGGWLQALLFGYGGLRIHQDQYYFYSPQLPPNTTSLKIRGFSYNSATFNMYWDDASVEIELTSPVSIHFFNLEYDGSVQRLHLNQPLKFDLGEFAITPII